MKTLPRSLELLVAVLASTLVVIACGSSQDQSLGAGGQFGKAGSSAGGSIVGGSVAAGGSSSSGGAHDLAGGAPANANGGMGITLSGGSPPTPIGGTGVGGSSRGGAGIGFGGSLPGVGGQVNVGGRLATGGTPSGGVPTAGVPNTGGAEPAIGGNGVGGGGVPSGGGVIETGAAGSSPLGAGGESGVNAAGEGGSAGAEAGEGGSAAGGGEGDLCEVGTWDGTPPQPLNLSGNTFAHDPTMVEADGIFYRYWTGDYLPSATSTNLIHWQDAPTVYGRSYSSWVDSWLAGIPAQEFNFPWAPDASYFGGKYHLYSTFSAVFGDNISCVTHLTTNDPGANDWTDHGPVICTQGNEAYNAIDADAGQTFDGTPYLAFGSFWDGIMLFELNADGSAPTDPKLVNIARNSSIEAPVLFRRCGWYYLFVSFGACCKGNSSTYNVRVGRSESILGPYVDRDGKGMLDGGGTLMVAGDGVHFAAAGHSDVIVVGDKIYHQYHAYAASNGDASLRIVEMPFDDEGWPVPGGP